MNEPSDTLPQDGPDPSTRSGEGTSRVHRSLHLRSAVNTLLFYGTVVAFCLLLPVIVASGVGVFFLFFYKGEIAAFVRSPLGKTRLRTGKKHKEGPYRLERLPPGAFDQP